MQTQTVGTFRTTYGQRGGTGPTAGRKLEVITSACGLYSTRVFKGQRWLVVTQQDENAPVHVAAAPTEAKAAAWSLCALPDCLVSFYVHAAPAGERAMTIAEWARSKVAALSCAVDGAHP